jgi:hypothetical protein
VTRLVFEASFSDLKDHASPAKVERIWRRLRSDLGEVERRPRAAWWWVPATFVIVFGSGVLVGANWAEPEHVVTVEPERGLALTEPGGPPAPPAVPLRPREPKHAPIAVKQRRLAPAVVEAREPSMSIMTEEAPPEAVVTPSVVESPEWQLLASLGEYAPALQAVEASGGFDSLLGTASAEELLILVDIARATGQRGRAIQALRLVTQRYPDDPSAPIAAMMLGNLLLQSGDPAGAAKAFELNRRLSPKGDFAEDALAREFEAKLRQGELTEAQRLAEQYEHDFPQGRRLDEIRAELAKALDESEPSDKGEPADAADAEDELGGNESTAPFSSSIE